MENNLKFLETKTIEQFKAEQNCSRIDVKQNPHTGKLFMTYNGKTGMVATKGIPEHPMISKVEGVDNTGATFTCWLLHEEGNGAPTLASF